MQRIYETHIGMKVTDFESESEARAMVEAHGSGYVVTFIRGFDGRDRSVDMHVYENAAWRGVYIHG